MNLKQNISLKSMNTLGVEAMASYFVAIETVPEFQQLVNHAIFPQVSKVMLGEGSNILFTQDYPGLVIKNAMKGIKIIAEDNDYISLLIGGGENWHQLVMYCVQHGYAGIENLSLIPGTVGAAPIQNIGAYGVELKDCFVQLEALNLQDGSIRTFTIDDCRFGYRDSIFKNEYKNQFAILNITLKLNKKPIFHLEYGAIKETLQMMQVKQPTIKAISDAVIHIRRSKLPDPKELGNAGSFFKNPLISHPQFQRLQKSFPNLPHFDVPNSDEKKISAAWLIEQCGWKGKRFGDVGIYEKQALILVNYGDGSAKEIKELAEKIQQSVQKEFGIRLIPEVNFI